MMETAALDFKRAYRLTPDRGPRDDVVSQLRIDSASSSTTVLEKLKLELGAATRESVESAANGHATIRAKRASVNSVTTDSQTGSRRAVEVVRKAALVVIAVIALAIASLFVGTKLIESNASKSPQATSETVAPPAAPKQVVTAPKSTQGIAADSQTLPASVPQPDAAPPVRAARGAEGLPTPTPDLTQPVTAPTAATAMASAKIKSKVDPSPAAPVPADATSDRSSPRCSRIMEKATLGEALSTEEKKELASSCR